MLVDSALRHCGLAKAVQIEVIDSDYLHRYIANSCIKRPSDFKSRVVRKLCSDGSVLAYPVSP